jgi:hypothetical protein
MLNLCDCGCGVDVKVKGRRFIIGHNGKFNIGSRNGAYKDGRSSKRYKCKVVGCNEQISWNNFHNHSGKCHSHTIREMIETKKFHEKNCGCPMCKSIRKEKHLENCLCASCLAHRGEQRGVNGTFYGKRHTREAKMIIGLKSKGRMAWNKGKNRFNDYRIRRISRKLIEINKLKFPISQRNKSYPESFDNNLRERIKYRDKYRCAFCFISEEEHLKKYKRKLSIHHIDIFKTHCSENNLITLCVQCHARTNFRDILSTGCYFKERIDIINQEHKGLFFYS